MFARDFGSHVDVDLETISKTRFLDVQVGAQKLHLVANGCEGA